MSGIGFINPMFRGFIGSGLRRWAILNLLMPYICRPKCPVHVGIGASRSKVLRTADAEYCPYLPGCRGQGGWCFW